MQLNRLSTASLTHLWFVFTLRNVLRQSSATSLSPSLSAGSAPRHCVSSETKACLCSTVPRLQLLQLQLLAFAAAAAVLPVSHAAFTIWQQQLLPGWLQVVLLRLVSGPGIAVLSSHGH